MKLERLPEYVLPAVVTLGGMGFAVLMGYLMGQGRVSSVVGLLVALCLGFLTLMMRQYIWLLIPLAWPLTGTIPLLPVPLIARPKPGLARALRTPSRRPECRDRCDQVTWN